MCSVGERSGFLAGQSSCTPWSLSWDLSVMSKCILEDDPHQVYAIYKYVHHSHTDRTYSHYWRHQSTIPRSSRLFRDTRVAILGSVVVYMVAWPKAHITVSCCKQMVPNGPWWYSRCNMYPDFFPGCCSGGTAVRTMRRSWHASVLCDCPEPGLRVWKCSTDYCWKKKHTTDTLCPTCAAIHPASHRPAMRPHSNGRIAITGARCVGQSITKWHLAPLWPFACENTCLHWCQRGLHCVLMWLLSTPYCDMCVSVHLNLSSYTVLLQW